MKDNVDYEDYFISVETDIDRRFMEEAEKKEGSSRFYSINDAISEFENKTHYNQDLYWIFARSKETDKVLGYALIQLYRANPLDILDVAEEDIKNGVHGKARYIETPKGYALASMLLDIKLNFDLLLWERSVENEKYL